jgi:hypothetical protein
MVSGKLYKGLNKLFMREKKSTTKKLYSNKVLGAASSNQKHRIFSLVFLVHYQYFA